MIARTLCRDRERNIVEGAHLKWRHACRAGDMLQLHCDARPSRSIPLVRGDKDMLVRSSPMVVTPEMEHVRVGSVSGMSRRRVPASAILVVLPDWTALGRWGFG